MKRLIAVALLAACAAGCNREPRPKRQTERNLPSIGFMDSPAPESTVGPMFVVAGWALDESNVDRVRVYLDDELVATLPMTLPRPDVEKQYPGRGPAGRPLGFQTMIDAGARSGYCTIRLEALDGRGALTQIATATVKIEP